MDGFKDSVSMLYLKNLSKYYEVFKKKGNVGKQNVINSSE